MMNEQKVPQLRFSGFEDEWEEKIFQDLFERRMERNNGQFGYDRWISVAKMYFQEPEKVTSNNIDTRTYVMRKSDIAFEGHSNKEFKLGRFVENDIGDGVISELFPIYKHKDEYNLSYWKYAIQNENIMFPKLTKCIEVSYTSSNKLDENFFLNEKILVPIVREQQKIGFFLSQIDTLIQTKTQKLESLKSVKKSLLQKCFPKAGEKVPEMRFAEFSGDWEEKKLGEIAEKFDYGLNAAATDFDGKNKYLRITDIDDENRYFKYDDVSSPDCILSESENYLLKENDIVFARTGASVGKSYIYNKQDGIVYFAGFLIRAHIKQEYDSLFIFQNTLTESYNKYIQLTSQRSGQPGVNAEEYKEYSVMCPSSLDEQQKIGQFFSKYDSLISAQQKEIDKLKDIKKSLLQKMFV